MLVNGDFTDGKNDWYFYCGASPNESLGAVNCGGGDCEAKAVTGGGTDYCQLLQRGLTLEPSSWYQLRFSARHGAGAKNLDQAHVILDTSPYSNLKTIFSYGNVDLSTTMQTFEYTFKTNSNDCDGPSGCRLRFRFEHNGAGDEFFMDDIHLCAGQDCLDPTPPAEEIQLCADEEPLEEQGPPGAVQGNGEPKTLYAYRVIVQGDEPDQACSSGTIYTNIFDTSRLASLVSFYETVSSEDLVITGNPGMPVIDVTVTSLGAGDVVQRSLDEDGNPRPASQQPSDVGCPTSELEAAVSQAIAELELDPPDFEATIYPTMENAHGDECDIAGLAGGGSFRVYRCSKKNVWTHEMGHVLGMGHAGRVNGECGNDVPEVYCDLSDTMGKELHYLNAPNLIALGWLPTEKVETVALTYGPEQFVVSALELDPLTTANPHVITFLRGGYNYYLSTRLEDSQLTSSIGAPGAHPELGSEFTNGLSIHRRATNSNRTWLLDTIDNNQTYAGSSFSVKQLSRNASNHTVTLELTLFDHWCGDGTLDPEEECDDGNTNPGDGCDENCEIVPFCGDGIIDADAGEECDDGNTKNSDACRNDCQLPSCGDGIVQRHAGDPQQVVFEECDDGNANDSDACSNSCQLPSCGNGVIDTYEECDDGNGSFGDGCDGHCIVEECGNAVLQAAGLTFEGCDDGNSTNGDGCTKTCEQE